MNSAQRGETRLIPHILVVDDEPELRHVVTCFLRIIGARISCAEDVPSACRLLQQETIDVIVSDVMMPGENGISFLARVHDYWPDIPVILMTGHAELQMAVDAIKNGAFDFVHKPLNFDLLRKSVERAINHSKLQMLEKNYRAELEQMVATRTAELQGAMLELDYARSALLKAATEKSEFMATVSHEMRTPMNGVIGSLDLLCEEKLTGAAAEYLAMARQSADEMVTLIDHLLSFNSLNVQGGRTVHADLIDLHPFLQTIIAEQQPLFTRKGLALLLQMADDLPQQIRTDRGKLRRLFEILLGNARKFTEHGCVSLAVSRFCSGDGGELLYCTVTDSGIGIRDGLLERIFEPFVQGDGSLTRRFEGVGLGLAIARQNALLLNGHLWAEHVPDGGSRFTVTLKINTP